MAITRLVIELEHEPDGQDEATAALMDPAPRPSPVKSPPGSAAVPRYYVRRSTRASSTTTTRHRRHDHRGRRRDHHEGGAGMSDTGNVHLIKAAGPGTGPAGVHGEGLHRGGRPT